MIKQQKTLIKIFIFFSKFSKKNSALAAAEAEYGMLEEKAMEVVDAYTKATDV